MLIRPRTGLSTMRAVSQDIGEASCHDLKRLFVDGAFLVRSKLHNSCTTPVDRPRTERCRPQTEATQGNALFDQHLQ